MKDTNKINKHMDALIHFNTHRALCQSDEKKCMWTQNKDGTTLFISHIIDLQWNSAYHL